MNTTTTHRSTSLPGAPDRATLAEAEADEARGVDLAAFLAILPTLTAAERDSAWAAARDSERLSAWAAAWDAAWAAAWDAARAAAWAAARDAAWDAARDAERAAGWAAVAIVVRDLISVEHFTILTAPMRAAGVEFDRLGADRQDGGA